MKVIQAVDYLRKKYQDDKVNKNNYCRIWYRRNKRYINHKKWNEKKNKEELAIYFMMNKFLLIRFKYKFKFFFFYVEMN